MGTKKKKVLLVTTIPSPFQVELAEAITKSESDWELDVWFASPLPSHRGRHWLAECESNVAYFAQHPRECAYSISLKELTCKNNYRGIVSGLPVRLSYTRLLADSIRLTSTPLIRWSEQPLPTNSFLMLLKYLNYYINSLLLPPKAIFAIGDRAVTAYSKVYRCPVHCVPYFQDLRITDSAKTSSISKRQLIFVFSGQLIERNNIFSILKAVESLINRGRKNAFKVMFFGRGSLEALVRTYEDKYPDSIELVTAQPSNWNRRLDPLRKSDVLLCPSLHSGWGLTIPEALSLGLPVIATPTVESARYYIRDGVNGILCQKTYMQIANAMLFFLDSPNLASEMAQNCILTSRFGSVDMGSETFIRFFDRYFH